MDQNQLIEHRKTLAVASSRFRWVSIVNTVFGILLLFRGSAIEDHGLIAAGVVLLAAMYLFRQVGVMYSILGSVLDEIDSTSYDTSEGSSASD